MEPDAEFRAVPLATVWREYLQAASEHKMERIPQPPPAGSGVLTDRGDFACGVCLYPTQCGVVIAEFLVTNPQMPMWERHWGVILLAKTIDNYATCAGLDLWMPIRHPGVKRAVERAGLFSRQAEIYGLKP